MGKRFPEEWRWLYNEGVEDGRACSPEFIRERLTDEKLREILQFDETEYLCEYLRTGIIAAITGGKP